MPKHITLVNQKLAFTRSLLGAARAVGEPTNARQRLERQALLDGAVFHLWCAYLHYLRELADIYAVGAPEAINNEVDLHDALGQLDKSPTEATELQNLAARPHSWLWQLLASHRHCWQGAIETPTPSPRPMGEQIAMVDLDRDKSPVATPEKLQHWYDELTDLIERHRETSAEY